MKGRLKPLIRALLARLHPRYWMRLLTRANLRHYGMPFMLIALLSYLISDIPKAPPDPPQGQRQLCGIFHQQPDWYDAAVQAHKRWGTPISTLMAFIQVESGFDSYNEPPRTHLLGFIPWRRPSTAYGYAQAEDDSWREFKEDTDQPLARRWDIGDAMDFIGWYNHRSHHYLGLSFRSPDHLYLAYHEGLTGYRHHSYRHKPQVRHLARHVALLSHTYSRQLPACEKQLRCRHFYQFWPFCR